ncbi:MAG: hypothetical protein JWN04_3562 [Myxococcaceae bacterium]|nr:hypothetical protein [Myxococcaceae bacterium]
MTGEQRKLTLPPRSWRAVASAGMPRQPELAQLSGRVDRYEAQISWPEEPMRRTALAYVCGGYVLALASGCSNPQCPDGQRKVGTVCLLISRDGATALPNPDGGMPLPFSGSLDAAVLASSGPDGGGPARSDSGLPFEDATSETEAGPGTCQESARCSAGMSTACMTSCGTQGNGLCSTDCQPPSGLTCIPPTESCNGRDDDCDGIIDQSLYTSLPSGRHVWTSSLTNTSTSTDVLPRANGGFWVLLRKQVQSPIELHQLDARGLALSNTVVLDRTNTLGSYLAATDGKWIVILIESSSYGLLTTSLQLYRSEDGGFVSEYELVGDRTDCGLIKPTGIAVIEDEGTARIAFARSRATFVPDANGQCPIAPTTAPNNLFFTSYSEAGGWSSPTPSTLNIEAGSVFYARINLSKVPCRSEWLASYADSTQKVLRRFSYAGAELNNLDSIVSGVDEVTDMAALTVDCRAGHASVALAYAAGTGAMYRAHVRRLGVETSSGAVSQLGADLDIAGETVWGGRLTQSGNRAFFAGLDGMFAARLFELEEQPNAPRELAVHTIGTRSSPYATADGAKALALAASFGARLALSSTDSVLVVSVASDSILSGLEAFRDPGDTNLPVAVTYRVGCPE